MQHICIRPFYYINYVIIHVPWHVAWSHRLNLPGKVVETANSSAKYDADEQSFVITLDKVTPGEVFPNLDMLTRLLEPKRDTASSKKPLIEVVSSMLPTPFTSTYHSCSYTELLIQ